MLIKISKIEKFGREKYNPAKFANFVLICIVRGKYTMHIWAESGAFSRA